MSPKGLTGGTGATARPVLQGGRSPREVGSRPRSLQDGEEPGRVGGLQVKVQRPERLPAAEGARPGVRSVTGFSAGGTTGPRGVTYPARGRTARKPPRGDSDQQAPPECFAVTEDFPLKHTPPPPEASWVCGTRIGRGRQGPRGSRRLASPSLSRNRVESGPEREEPRRTWHLLTRSKTRARTRGLGQLTPRRKPS